MYAVACALTTVGLMTFGVISFHLVNEHLVTAAVVPVVYAAAMGADAVASLGTGFAYDRVGGGTLLLLPVVVAAVPVLVFTDRVGLAVTGVLLWGAATGVQDSTVKALVADLVPPRGWPRRTAPSRRSRPWPRWSGASSPDGCTTSDETCWSRRSASPRPSRSCCSSASSFAGGTATRADGAGLG